MAAGCGYETNVYIGYCQLTAHVCVHKDEADNDTITNLQLQRYPLLLTPRLHVWLMAVLLHTKLCDSKGELEKTVAFVLQIRLSV